jgi:hypothetical protein
MARDDFVAEISAAELVTAPATAAVPTSVAMIATRAEIATYVIPRGRCP